MARALTYQNIAAYRPKSLNFTGSWLSSFGCPELAGSWLIWGNSGNGKTRFALQLAKYLCGFGHVIYDSLEEGLSLSLQKAIVETNLHDVNRRFLLLDKEPVAELAERLARQKSAGVVIIDSIQYSGLSYVDYKAVRARFPQKLFILISHADGKAPAGRVARSIRFDANVKVWIEGYRAFPVSRYGGGEPFTIWNEGVVKYWNEV
ncbi:MAG: hypothetical protein LBD76_06610 [Prevotellaceae bacterium]|jgi:hypothetical protein|nr:hypothetical protein [Prevotellaceae bacterium]